MFRNCRFLGWQDTILLNRGRQYFDDCYIDGHVDFIFGGATAFFDNCHIHCLRNGYITAASTPDVQPFGFVFADCKITAADAGREDVSGSAMARVRRGDFFEHGNVRRRPSARLGQLEVCPTREKQLRYAEFKSTGPSAKPDDRVPWSKQLNDSAQPARSQSRKF